MQKRFTGGARHSPRVALAARRGRTCRPRRRPSATTPPLDRINHIVVIYEENHSFDNLYGGWEGVNGRANADAAHTTQVDQHGVPYACLKQNDVNLTSPPLAVTCTDAAHGISSAFATRGS